MDTPASIIVAAIGGIPVVWAAYLTARGAIRTKQEEMQRPDWAGFSDRLERIVADQGRKIDELYGKLSELRNEVRGYERRHDIMLSYLRQVFSWAVRNVPEGVTPPSPPKELSKELEHWIW